MDEEMRKRIERRAQEILDEDPKERAKRVRRLMAERIAYHEIAAEERERARRKR
jgi:replicative superfamily II helicase